jgi:ABC-type lipoprotein export system ATPase subunit
VNLIQLSDYFLSTMVVGKRLRAFDFKLQAGDICAIESDVDFFAHTFLRALATLDPPLSGIYQFQGATLDFSDYRNLLPYKRQIAYIAPDAAMISNRTVGENLLLMRYYYENSLSIEMDAQMVKVLRMFDIYDKLNLRPAQLSSNDLQMAILLREMIKAPKMLLLNQPEDFIGHTKFNLLVDIFRRMVSASLGVVFFSHDDLFAIRFANRRIVIKDGLLTVNKS